MSSDPNAQSQGRSLVRRGTIKESRGFETSGPGAPASGTVTASQAERKDRSFRTDMMGYGAAARANEPEPIEIEVMIDGPTEALAVNLPLAQQDPEVSILQYQVVYTQPMSDGRLDVAAPKPNIAGAALQAGTLVASGVAMAFVPHGREPNLAERRDHMPEKETQGHFVQEMAKSLSPQFDELKVRSSAIEERLSSVAQVVTEQGYAISDLGRQFANYYEQSIAHSRNLEGEITSLRREMNEHSSKMNALLETIAHSLTDRSAI